MADKMGGEASSSAGAILYRPASDAKDELISCNEQAWRTLCFSVPQGKGGDKPTVDIAALCARWRELFSRSREIDGGPGESDDFDAGIIDVIQSGQRQYGIKTMVLSDRRQMSESQTLYLFILERITSREKALSVIFRNLKLNKREREIVLLLLHGSCNKEIADSLGLSINTVKGYMKLLSRKLGVNNRAGIVSAIVGLKMTP